MSFWAVDSLYLVDNAKKEHMFFYVQKFEMDLNEISIKFGRFFNQNFKSENQKVGGIKIFYLDLKIQKAEF